MGPVDVRTETSINRPCPEVAGYAVDPDNAPHWYKNIKSVQWRSAKPLQAGSQLAFSAQFLGRKLDYVYEIIELVPGEKLVMRTAEGPFPMETTYTWSPLSDSTTRMTLRNRGEPTGFSRYFAPFMAAMMTAANRKDLSRIKAILEKR